jgi:hypothetical protein
LAVACSGFCNDITLAPAWAACQDIGRKHAAIVAGTMNMIGNLGGFLGTIFTGWLISSYQTDFAATAAIQVNENGSYLWGPGQERDASMMGFQWNLVVNCIVYLIAAACWIGIDATKPIESELEQGH